MKDIWEDVLCLDPRCTGCDRDLVLTEQQRQVFIDSIQSQYPNGLLQYILDKDK